MNRIVSILKRKGGAWRTALGCLVILAAAPLWMSGRRAWAQEGFKAGIVTYVKGKVALTRAGQIRPQRANVGEIVYEGDVLKTARRERASVAMIDGAEIHINENTEFELTRQGGVQRQRSVRLILGDLWTRLLHKGSSSLMVQTPTAVAAVRGTEADIDMANILTVKVYEGLVDVTNANGKQSLTAGQITQVSGPNSAPSAPRQMAKSEYGTWQKGIQIKNLDRLLQQLQSASNSPGSKTLNLQIEKDGQKKNLQLKFKKK